MVQLSEPRRSSNRVANALSRLPKVPDSPNSADHDQLANELASELWKKLSFARVADEFAARDIKQVVTAAASSHLQILGWYDDLRSFANALCVAAVEIRGEESAERALSDRIVSGVLKRETLANLFSPPPTSFIDYRFADLPPDVALARADQHLEKQCLQLVNDLFQLLDRLQERQLVGNYETTKSTCRFNFYRRIAIIQDHSVKSEERIYRDLDRSKGIRDSFELTKSEIQHRNAMHIHHVHDPVIRKLGQAEHPLPEKYQQFVDACPEWIRPKLTIIEGDLFREQHIEWDTISETFTVEKLIESRKFKWQQDPAILLGNYVLAGWGEQAIEIEIDRLRKNEEAVQYTANLAKAKWYQAGSLLLAMLSILLVAVPPLAIQSAISVSILLGLVAMYFAVQSRELSRPLSDLGTSLPAIYHGLMFGSLVFLFQSLAVGLLQRSLIALVFTLLFAALAWGLRQFRPQEQYQEAENVD